LGAKRLELVREFVPKLTRVAIIWEDTNPGFALTVREVKTAVKSLGLSLQIVGLKAAGGIDNAFAAVAKARAQGLIFAVPASISSSRLMQYAALAMQYKIPTIYAEKEYVKVGGLASYGPNYIGLFRRIAMYAHKILKGAQPADLPVEQPTVFELSINLKTAKALDLRVPPTLLARANEVIE
jgi:putative ABC transport system substrate-binding protein